MELAGRVFDVVTQEERISDDIRKVIPEISPGDKRNYWRRVLRMAALCHDIGHLPFSHAAEKELLPSGFTHEDLTRELILSEEMNAIWQGMTPPLRSEEIAKLALGPQKGKGIKFSTWEAILSEIIVGDAFGVDRMDYLLRDSHHLGVPYGKFDHFRLIDTLIILPESPTEEGGEPGEPTLGVITGGIHSAESLLLARYFMFSQVYFHSIRRIYDIHLMDFLKLWLPGGKFSTD
ncbi:MAG: HD domain-containing protein, partial [Candidatus Brocadiales bacterium]|nr:HD domain-containing protein [Candidatus Bathyanammoxibius sp.]